MSKNNVEVLYEDHEIPKSVVLAIFFSMIVLLGSIVYGFIQLLIFIFSL